MNTQDTTELRDLTSDEIEDVSGALKGSLGPFRVKYFEDGLYFSLSIDGLGSFNVDDEGVWGNVGSRDFSIP
jgi:hypothetical protein